MAMSPLALVSYVGGPALLSNATALFILSTSNRFARSLDRARILAERPDASEDGQNELRDAHRRVRLIVRALTSFYFAAATFALGTLAAIAGAAIAEIQNAPMLSEIVGGAATVGILGFVAFVVGAVCLVIEARITERMFAREAEVALALARKT
jgi:hypothetical protein